MWKKSRVALEPIPGGLFSGISVKRICVVKEKYVVTFPGPKNLSLWLPLDGIKEFCQDGFIFPMVSSIKHYTGAVDTIVWKPFTVNNCKIDILPSSVTVVDKFARVAQRFRITGRPSGSFQMMCQNWKAKFQDQYYTRNDILTVHYGKNKPSPWPLSQNVLPEEVQTFVPVTTGSKVSILVNREKQTIDSVAPGSKVKFIGEVFFDHSFPYLGSPLCVHRFRVAEPMTTSESLFLVHKKWHNEYETRAVVFVPYKETAGFRYVVIEEPCSKATILTEGCQAVKLVTRTSLPIKLNDNCPVNLSFVSRVAGLTVYMIVFRSMCPMIIVDKSANGWEVRCPY